MIIPAAVFRIVGFLKKDTETLENEVQEGGLVFCYSDAGKPLILQLESNKANVTLDEIKTYLENKRNSVLKQKEVDAVAGELDYLEDFEVELEEAMENFSKENPSADKKAQLQFKKEYKNKKATEIVTARRTISKNTIIRTVIDLPNTGAPKTYKFKGIEFPLIRSRCIIFDNEGKPSTSGLYYFSQTPNAIPISIKPVFNKENEAINLFAISLSKVATLDHFNYLIDHIVRSVNKFVEKNTNAFIPNLSYNYDEVKKDQELISKIKKITELAKKKEVAPEEGLQFIDALWDLKEYVNKNPKLILHVQPVFNLMLSPEYMKNALNEVSPFSNIEKSFVSLNFSKENPDQKTKKKEIVSSFIKELANGENKGEVITIYHTPAIKLSEESESWGFMNNNVQMEQMILSYNDTYNLYQELAGE